jgi:cytochrome c55X
MRATRVFWPALALLGAATSAFPDSVAPAREAELIRFVRQDCGSCHGITLKGGLGPPLVAGALGGKPVEYLKYTILYGRPGTPMPPWRAFLTEADAEWIAARLLKGFPDAR